MPGQGSAGPSAARSAAWCSATHGGRWPRTDHAFHVSNRHLNLVPIVGRLWTDDFSNVFDVLNLAGLL
jgi:hypothetical protein